jgi:hypothetical protein
MRQFWSMRSNNWQHIAQTLRFECPLKQGIIAIVRDDPLQFPATSGVIGCRITGVTPQSGSMSCIQDLARPIAIQRESFMAKTVVKLRLNQQQLELMDRTIAQGVAPDRVSLVRLALREYAAAHQADAATKTAQ